jgi:DNA-binding MarR family transcriptional regulator
VHQPHESTDGPSDITDLLQAVGGMAKALRSMNSASESDHGARAILSALYRCGPVRPSDLAGTCMLDISTISRHARQLESEQLVAKIADPEDRRAHRLALTETGIGKVEGMWHERMSVLEQKLAGWTAPEISELVRLSRRFCADLGVSESVHIPSPDEARDTHLAALNSLNAQEHALEREGSQQ